jgi:magnesium transporter
MQNPGLEEIKAATKEELFHLWPSLGLKERAARFQSLPREETDDFFLALDARDKCELILALPEGERRIWMRLVPPDDAADVVQLAP